MRASELKASLSSPPVDAGQCCSTAATGDDDYEWDVEEDFWEAIDLLCLAHKQLTMVLRYCQVGAGRRKVLGNLKDDMKQFIDHFVDEEDTSAIAAVVAEESER